MRQATLLGCSGSIVLDDVVRAVVDPVKLAWKLEQPTTDLSESDLKRTAGP